MTTNARSTFNAADVQTIFDVTFTEAEAFLDAYSNNIADAMTVAGWQAIETFGDMTNLKRKEDDDDGD